MTSPAPSVGAAPAGGGFVPGAGPAAVHHTGVAAEIVEAPTLDSIGATASRRHLRLRAAGSLAIGLAVLLVVVWFITNQTPLITFALALLLAIVVDGAVALSGARTREVEIAPTGPAIAGDPTRWSVSVEGFRRTVSLRTVRLPTPPPVLVDRPEPGTLVLPPTTRGVVHFVVFDLRSIGPIGFTIAARRIRATPPTPVVVGPRQIPLHIRWPVPRATGYGLSEVAPRGDDLFRGVRPYQRGDERRKIHWKATARTNELMVREDDGTGVIALQIAVDLGPSVPVNDHIVANAAWLANSAVHRGWLVQLVTVDASPKAPIMPELGSPFGRTPRVIPAHPEAPRVLAQTVSGSDDISRQLSTAAPGMPPTPAWTGLRCRVGAEGVTWP